MGAAVRAGRDKLALADGGSAITGFGDWAEQLIAESTGKEGRGILPVVVESADAPGRARPRTRCWPSSAPRRRPGPRSG